MHAADDDRSTRMNKRVAALIAAMVPVGGLLIMPTGGASATRTTIPLDDATMIIEVNSTDGDAGLQVFLDGEPWRSIEVRSPDGRKILAVEAKRELRDHGLTELFSESNEPSFDELPLEEFLALFSEGEYRFSGTTVEGARLTGTATLSHDIPAGPVIVSPEDGAVVSPDALVVEWEPVTAPAGIDIAGYQVVVEREDPLRVFQVTLPSTATSITVPAEFLEAATDYKVEVLAIEANGNQTITENAFVTS
jgi:hypothetical protein